MSCLAFPFPPSLPFLVFSSLSFSHCLAEPSLSFSFFHSLPLSPLFLSLPCFISPHHCSPHRAAILRSLYSQQYLHKLFISSVFVSIFLLSVPPSPHHQSFPLSETYGCCSSETRLLTSFLAFCTPFPTRYTSSVICSFPPLTCTPTPPLPYLHTTTTTTTTTSPNLSLPCLAPAHFPSTPRVTPEFIMLIFRCLVTCGSLLHIKLEKIYFFLLPIPPRPPSLLVVVIFVSFRFLGLFSLPSTFVLCY